MAFLDDLSKKISQAGQSAVQKTKGFTGSAKINGMISDEEKSITNSYLQIGKLYFELHKDDFEEDFSGFIQSIRDSEAKIVEYKQQLQDIKGTVHCEQCGAEVASNVAFCSTCGAKMPVQAPKQTDPNQIKCSACGAFVNKNMRFCTSCGKPMEDTSKEEVTDIEETVTETVVDSQPEQELESQPQVFVEPQAETVVDSQNNNESELIFCTNCGMRLEKGDLFCTICGSKVK